ncbi:MAG: hypothetical protein ACW98Y_06865 [Candidatus Thorarchaeota archaeon]
MRNWNPLTLSAFRLFLVILLPLSIEIRFNREVMEFFYYNSILTRFIIPQDVYFDTGYLIESVVSPILLLGSIMLISAPLMYFEFELRSMPPENSALSLASWMVLFSGALAFALSYMIGFTYPYYWIMSDMMAAFIWSSIVFVVIPTILRETRLLEIHMKKGDSARPPKRNRPNSYTILGYILGIIVSIAPHSLFVFNLTQGYNIALTSNSFSINQIVERYTIIGPIIENRIMFQVQNYASNPLTSILFLGHLYFCIYLLRYFKGRAKRNRVILLGLGVAFGPAIYNLTQSFLFIGVANIPIPMLIIIGFILMKKIPVVKVEESVWDETPKQKWFEEPKVMGEEGMVFVKVPVRYLILSKLRGRRPNKKSSQIEFETEKVDEEDIWSD